MCGDEHREHALGLVELDEAHAAHVRGKLIYLVGAFTRLLAVTLFREIKLEVLDAVVDLMPLVQRLDVDAADVGVALAKQVGC